MKRIFGLLVILLVSISQCIAQTASIDNVWVDFDVVNNGNKGMRIHVKFDVSGLKNRKIYVSASFSDEKKNRITCYSDGYKTTSNTMVSYCYSTPTYENSTYSDFQLFMPYYVFNNSNMQSGTYSFFIGITNVSNWKQLTTSNWYDFTYTRGSNPNPYQNSNRFANGRVKGETWTKKTNDSFEDVYIQQSDGSVKDVLYMKCISCFGTGKCQFCHGQGGHGGYWIAGRYIYTQCTACFGKCICSACNGTKKTILRTDILYPVQNFPELANNSNYWKRNDGYYEKNTYYVPINTDYTRDDYTSDDKTSSVRDITGDALYASYIKHYQSCEHLLYDMWKEPSVYYNDSHRREYQSTMRRIRQNVLDKGWPSIAKSTWEDWDGTR